jgi:hypothetical protein
MHAGKPEVTVSGSLPGVFYVWLATKIYLRNVVVSCHKLMTIFVFIRMKTTWGQYLARSSE